MIGTSPMRQAAALRLVEHLDEERVAVRDHVGERHPRQRLAAPAAIAAGAVARRQRGDEADVAVGERAQEDPVQRPVDDADAVQVARADDEVVAPPRRSTRSGRYSGSCERSASIWQMKSARPSRIACSSPSTYERPRPRGPVRCITSIRPGCLAAERVGDRAGAVRGPVVDDEHAGAVVLEDPGGQDRQVVALVIRRE